MDKAGGSSEKSGMVLPVNTGHVWLFSVSSDFGQGTGKREAGEEYNMNLTCSSRGVPKSPTETKVLVQDNLGWGKDRPGTQAHTLVSRAPQVPAIQRKSLSSSALASSSVP